MEQPSPSAARPAAIRSSSKILAPLAVLASLALVSCGEEAAVTEPAPVQTGASETVTEVPVAGAQRDILAFGDSLFAGYNVPKDDSYPAKLEAALRAAGVNARVVNAGVSGDTSAAGRQRFEFTLDAQEEAPDLLILELGGNDLLRGIDPAQTRANLAAMIETAQARGIDVLLMGMQAPPNVGPEFQAEFSGLYTSLAEEYGVAVIPNWVEDVASKPELIQSDRIHPTVEGIEVLVESTREAVEAAIPDA
ncbi:arylesterase [Altererythrobacter sp. MTPC7]|uniref:arylesterase n=1 Tax=Altererythrobacter sp. MTPC7 TaxID=3056567 RepID=UPI0036F35B22